MIRSKSVLSVHEAGIGNNIFKIEPIKNLPLKQRIFWIFIKKYDHIICDNLYQIRNLKSLEYEKEKISLIKEFVPPIIKKEHFQQIPKDIQDFYESKDINLYGMGWETYRNGIDLYGMDMKIRLMDKIKKKTQTKKLD